MQLLHAPEETSTYGVDKISPYYLSLHFWKKVQGKPSQSSEEVSSVGRQKGREMTVTIGGIAVESVIDTEEIYDIVTLQGRGTKVIHSSK